MFCTWTFFDQKIFDRQGIGSTFEPEITIGAVPTMLAGIVIRLVKKIQIVFGVVQGITSFPLSIVTNMAHNFMVDAELSDKKNFSVPTLIIYRY